MARKGSRKVRTGCHTCKVRKVKCDEGKPACVRCTSTGRKCDGYPANREPGLSWYRPNHLFQSIDQPVEGRALQFFCQTAGPHLSGPLDSYFWTHLVLQFSNFEPAVRHSLVAISSLYEDFHCGAKAISQLDTNTFALHHYNAAIENLRKLENEPLILLVCVLFVCIEVLQGNREGAMRHSHHGIMILDRIGEAYPWTMEHLSPIFRRLGVFPLFFGSSVETFPVLRGLDAPVPAMFVSFAEAQYSMDAIILRASRLIRRGDAYRYGKVATSEVSPELLAEQEETKNTIGDWYASFSNLSERLNLTGSKDPAYCNIMARYRIASIWTQAAFINGECYYDQFHDDLKYVIDTAVEQSADSANSSPSSSPGSSAPPPARPTFSFEVGHMPFVICAVMKCRDLRTRLSGLSYLRGCGISRENMWEAERMYPVCKRQVEIEHEITLDEQDQPVGPVSWDTSPPETMRVQDFSSSPDIIAQVDASGRQIWGNMAYYSMRTVEGNLWTRMEFIPVSGPFTSDRAAKEPMRDCAWEPTSSIKRTSALDLVAMCDLNDIVLV